MSVATAESDSNFRYKILSDARSLLDSSSRNATLLDLVYIYRILLDRNPSIAELAYLDWRSVDVLREDFIAEIKRSPEFRTHLNFVVPGHLLMADLAEFRFWFNTSDVEMGLRMGFKVYEPETVNAIRDLVKEGMTCWDIGAQTGYYTCLFAHYVGATGKVVAYEPMPQSFAMVEKNLQENGFTQVVAVNAACSDASGLLTMHETSGMFIAGSGDGPSHTVPKVRLDEQRHPLPDLIKIDVEGHEPAVLAGLKGILKKSKPILIVELNEYWLTKCSNTTSAKMLAQLRRLGYECFDLESGKVIESNFTQDISGNINVLARVV